MKEKVKTSKRIEIEIKSKKSAGMDIPYHLAKATVNGENIEGRVRKSYCQLRPLSL